MSNYAIRVENLSKQYHIGAHIKQHNRLGYQLADTLVAPFRRAGKMLRGRARSAAELEETIWALREINFEVKSGEVLGIIGRNGAGKSTLLKILSRITEPTEGRIRVRGRVGSLLEVGTGFHPELTGRENVYLNGAILGMQRRDIDRKFDEIVAFAEIEKFIDTPVKHYSSGMYVRLAFAVAAHLEPEILVVDEVLAVGDVAFQKKCLAKMDDASRGGRTVLFVSHNMPIVQSLCDRGVILQEGLTTFDGPIDEAVKNYLASLDEITERVLSDMNPERSARGGVRIARARALNDTGQPTEILVSGKSTSFEFYYENPGSARKVRIGVTIYNQFGIAVTNLHMRLTNFLPDDLGAKGRFVCHIPELPLPLGQYRAALGVWEDDKIVSHIPKALTFEVASSVFYESGQTADPQYCTCMVMHNWQHHSAERSS